MRLTERPVLLDGLLSPPACSSPFAAIPMLEDLGCLYRSPTARNWNASREDCYRYGADLFVASTPEQFHVLKNHYYTANLRNVKWVGVIARNWLDGRLAVDVWNSGEPNGANDGTMCGVMVPSYLMDDRPCSNSYEYVCQANQTTT
ncbi:putative C-type lectin domain family 4 member G [Penaeus vannamei]|uniref:Putative C-type lectin domain family 4 member G n=1 Tax=Penaeus vannamei TaxID=6689 RepID=A0A3R7PH48_PENVA|nr:putative C-type lectin domain family 4 member G [Penaeus vannamei]